MKSTGLRIIENKPPLTRRWTWVWDSPASLSTQTSAHAEMDPPLLSFRPVFKPNLRSRGDGPFAFLICLFAVCKPPLTRRWTQIGDDGSFSGYQTSAHAEMDLSTSPDGLRRMSNLRSRGDGPFCSQPGIARSCKPPLTRRWTSASRSPPWTCTQTSAHAEMDLQSVKPSAVKATNLRSRGDGPYQTLARAKQASKPPLTRRWTSEEPVWISRSEQTSAHAEMDREGLTGHARSVPNLRTRGDGLLKATAARAA